MLKNTICGKNNICFKKTSNFITYYVNYFKTPIFFIYKKFRYQPTKLTTRILFKFIFYVEYFVVDSCNSSMTPGGRLFFCYVSSF